MCTHIQKKYMYDCMKTMSGLTCMSVSYGWGMEMFGCSVSGALSRTLPCCGFDLPKAALLTILYIVLWVCPYFDLLCCVDVHVYVQCTFIKYMYVCMYM